MHDAVLIDIVNAMTPAQKAAFVSAAPQQYAVPSPTPSVAPDTVGAMLERVAERLTADSSGQAGPRLVVEGRFEHALGDRRLSSGMWVDGKSISTGEIVPATFGSKQIRITIEVLP